ncbi:MAG: energy transducer TonB, partial [Bacteroidota bacterium]
MDFEVSGSFAIAMLGLVIVLTVAIIVLVGQSYKKRSNSNLSAKHAGTTSKSPLEGRSKYPEVDTFNLSTTFLNYGILAAIVLMICAFSWTQYDEVIDVSGLMSTLEEEIEVETPRTAEPPPPPPPPPPPVIQEVPNDVSIEETVVFKDQSIEEETVVEAPPAPKAEAPPPPPPPP